MNIPYSSTIVRAAIDGETASTHLDQIKTQLEAASWTTRTTVAATQTGTFTGTAGNNQTVTIGSTVYTFKTTLTGAAFEVLIGADATASANNLARAINNSGVAGTNYGTGTTAHPTVTASNSAGVLTITAITAGPGGSGIATTETVTNFSWVAAATSGGGYKLITKDDHPCKYRLLLYIYITNTGAVNYRPSPENELMGHDQAWLTMSAGRTFMLRATPYDVWIILAGTRTFFYAGALWNPAEWGPKTVTSITPGNPTTLTVTAHGFATADQVTLAQFSGDANWLAQNGRSFACTVTGANTFTIPLDSTSFATGTPGYAANRYQIGISLLACGSILNGNAAAGSFRTGLAHSFSGAAPFRCWTVFNQHEAHNGSNTLSVAGNVRIMGVSTSNQSVDGSIVGLTQHAIYQAAMVSHGIDSLQNTAGKYTGSFWNAVVWLGNAIVPNDLDLIPLDGRYFYNVTDRAGATTHYLAGCIFIEVPAP